MKWYSFFLVVNYVVLSDRYDYGLFENFEIIKDTFLREKTLTLRLESIREQLHNGMKRIYHNNFLHRHEYAKIRSQYIGNLNTKRKLERFELRRIFPSHISKNIQLLHVHICRSSTGCLDHPNYNFSIPVQEIIEGALKGLIMLHETYNLKLKEFTMLFSSFN